MTRGLFGILFVAAVLFAGQTKPVSVRLSSRAEATPLIREEQAVVVNGVSELWRLQWKSPPISVCGAEENDMAMTCPCSGFAYGESGQLDLVRVVNRQEIERIELTPFFRDADVNGAAGAVVQQWKPQDKDLYEEDSKEFAARVSLRPAVKIIEFADYNHDGDSSEFYIQTETLPCGKHAGIVVGLTRSNRKLHPFGTVLHPDKPLVMHKTEWDALFKARGKIELLDWACGDHGSDTETDLELHVTNGNIEGIRREYDCTKAGGRGRLRSEKPF